MKLRLPPFARHLHKMRLQGLTPKNVHIHCGNFAWQRAQIWIEVGAVSVAHLVFPKDTEPSEFRWHCLAGLIVSILHNPDGRDAIYPPVLEALAAEIVKAGAPKVYLIDYKWPLKVYAPKEIPA